MRYGLRPRTVPGNRALFECSKDERLRNTSPSARPLTLRQLGGTLRTFVGKYPLARAESEVRSRSPPNREHNSLGPDGTPSTRFGTGTDSRERLSALASASH